MLKKITYREEKTMKIKGIIESFNVLIIICKEWNQKKQIREVKKKYSTSFIQELKNTATICSRTIKELTKEVYGDSEDENDFEYLVAKVLTIYYITSLIINIKWQNVKVVNGISAEKLLINIRSILEEFAPEYSFIFYTESPPSYEATELKTVIDNIDNVDKEIANPIKELLRPMKNEDELRGLIAKVYANLEKTKPQTLKNLNEIDIAIAKRVWEIARLTVNNVDSAKGHKGESELSLKDIAHNFALNVSLFFRLVELNNDKEQK